MSNLYDNHKTELKIAGHKSLKIECVLQVLEDLETQETLE